MVALLRPNVALVHVPTIWSFADIVVLQTGEEGLRTDQVILAYKFDIC